MPLLRSLLNTFQFGNRPPVSTAKTLEEKDALAEWIVRSYFQNGSSTLESVLEREADIRFCSLLARHLCVMIFGSSGAELSERVRNVTDAMGYKLVVQRSGRLADTRTFGNVTNPVKYKGFGSTLNNPNARGHLFQINMLSFVESNPIIGVLEHGDRSTAYPTKGMKEMGQKGVWHLYELSGDLTDDMTALMVKPDKGDVKVEFAYFRTEDDPDPQVIYRLNSEK